MTHGTNTSNNHHPLHPRDDRETLSALFDGELPGDAARFALKRLDHDAGWRDTCGRWQLIGDALRGEATSAAPADFAAGVMRKLAAEGQAAVVAMPSGPGASAAPTAVATRRRWLGGAALAASVAMVAVLVARPVPVPSSAPGQEQVATGVVAPASSEQLVVARGEAAASTTIAKASSPATVVADTSPAARRNRASRPARSPQAFVDSPATVIAAVEPAATQKPFHPPVDEIATRPWPRAVLPETSEGSLTVGFGATSAPTSSLYPFEPRQLEAAPTKPAVAEPQR
jgi:Meckel syndrome type 1 protein